MPMIDLKNALLPPLLIAMLGPPAWAKECRGIGFPDRIQVSGTPLTLNGLGLREATLFKVKVYVAALYLAAPSADGEAILESRQPKRLILHFLRDVGREDISKAWDEGFKTGSVGGLQQRSATLNGWMKDLKTGERLVFTHIPGQGVQVEVAGKTQGTLPGDDFAEALFAIWLGADPPNAGLKTGLLGGGCG